VTRVEATLVQQLPFTLKFTLLGGYEQSVNNIFHQVPTFGQVSADGSTAIGKARLDVSPVPFVSAWVSYKAAKTTWKLGNEDAREPFELNTPDYVEDVLMQIALNINF
jgi:hypothetical protein